MTNEPIFLSKLALPVAWEVLGAAPSPEDRERVAWENANVLGFLLHSVDLDAAPRPSDERLAEALRPLHLKLDTVIEMLGRLSYRDVALPPVYEVELGASYIAWRSPRPPRPGTWLRLRIYFDSKMLDPIVLYAQVISVVQDDDSGDASVQAELTQIPTATSDSLARLALLAQRRQLTRRPTQLAGAVR